MPKSHNVSRYQDVLLVIISKNSNVNDNFRKLKIFPFQ